MKAYKRAITYGTFDLFHIGHLRLLERIASLAEEVVVAISSDEFNLLKNKVCSIPFEDRKDIVAALRVVTKVIKEEEWEAEVAAFAERLAAMPTKALGLIKRYINESWMLSLDEMLEKEAYGQRAAGQTNDHKEGVRAFLEKRRPVFTGN